MNIEHLRRALKSEWLTYYRKNRHWIIRLGVWVNYQGQRRPSASFILGAISTSDPQLLQLLPLVVELNSNPDRIVAALGLNFNPEDELKALAEAETPPQPSMQPEDQPAALSPSAPMLPSSAPAPAMTSDSSDPAIDTNRRLPLDTAQLSAHELPDREVARSTQSSSRRKGRNRKKNQWD